MTSKGVASIIGYLFIIIGISQAARRGLHHDAGVSLLTGSIILLISVLMPSTHRKHRTRSTRSTRHTRRH